LTKVGVHDTSDIVRFGSLDHLMLLVLAELDKLVPVQDPDGNLLGTLAAVITRTPTVKTVIYDGPSNDIKPADAIENPWELPYSHSYT
jgi:hypothetical protein